MAESVVRSRMQDLLLEEHTFSVPLVWGDEDDARTIDVFARVVAREDGQQLPYLLFLQGGPGHEGPRPFHAPASPSWLDTALEHYRVVLLDQRGTGRSTPVGDHDLTRGTDQLAEYLTHFRADAIVGDCEALRERLDTATWSVLGQSFGGFTTLSYLTEHPASLDHVFFTGGLSTVTRSIDEAYELTYEKMRNASETYYRRFPHHRDIVRELVRRAEAGSLVLPGGEVVSASRLRSLGSLLGSNNGWQTLHALLETPVDTNAFVYDLADALPFSARNPLYYVLHEACYANGGRTQWAADRVRPAVFDEDPTLLTGEHLSADWAQTVPGFQPWAEVSEVLAQHEWPALYAEDALVRSGARGAAAVYFNDRYVPVEYSLETAQLMPDLAVWVTSEHEHSGLREADVPPHLFDLAQHRRVR